MWFALFSQSGSEIVSIARHLGRWPDYIFTDNKDKKTWHRDLQKHSAVSIIKHKDMKKEIESNISMFQGLRGTTPIVTLHGYLRILPEINCEVFNGHPGDIVKYPELKGKDPQQKALDLKLPSTGTIIHKVTEEVDSGEIISYNTLKIMEQDTITTLSNALRSLSISLWIEFLKERFVETV
jgi:folate-dependent phosphoribosylglycinamide formyltransferase PurN